MRPPMSGIQASAAATFEGSPVVVVFAAGAGVGFAAGAGVGLTGSGMIHLEERRRVLSRQLARLFAFVRGSAPVRSNRGETNSRSGRRKNLRSHGRFRASARDRRVDRGKAGWPCLRGDLR